MIKVKKLNELAKIPTRANKTDAGADLYSVDDISIGSHERVLVHTGISLEIPENHYGRIAPRSGLALKNGIDVLAGVIDSSYRGEIGVILYNTGDVPFEINKGDRIAQLIIEAYYSFDFIEVNDLDKTERGSGGFGSTGK